MFTNWNYPTNILVGAGRANEIATFCVNKQIKNPLLVTDPGLAELPMVKNLLEKCQAAGLGIRIFSDIKPNPTGSNIKQGIKAYNQHNHDGIIALGGGSGLDAGKAIALMAKQTCDLFDIEDIGDNWQRIDTTKLDPVIAIPTTAGTGSEVGRASVIVHEEQQRKVIIFHPKLLPELVLLDPELSLGLPPGLTAATGMDALSHSLEALCATNFHPMAEGIALEGIRLVKNYLPLAVSQGDNIEARLQMLVASTMGATAFQRGLGAMHALAHPLGAVYDAHHGMLNAILMPYVLTANRDQINEPINRLSRYLDISGGFDGFLDWILALRSEIAIPHQLSAIISDDSEFARIAEMAVEDPSAASNPVDFDTAAYLDILTSAYSGSL